MAGANADVRTPDYLIAYSTSPSPAAALASASAAAARYVGYDSGPAARSRDGIPASYYQSGLALEKSACPRLIKRPDYRYLLTLIYHSICQCSRLSPMNKPTYTLTPSECHIAAYVGMRRRLNRILSPDCPPDW